MPWSKTSNNFWVANALFITCLLCAIWAIISSIQTKSILDDLPAKEDLDVSLADIEVTRLQRTILRYKRTPAFQHWVMVFIWQFPSMTMAYSWVTFLAALTVHVCDPLIRRSPWSDENKVCRILYTKYHSTDILQTAIVYLVIGFLGLATYVFTAVFVYMSEKDLEHHVPGTNKRSQTPDDFLRAAPPVLPAIERTSDCSKRTVSFEQFRKDGFVDIDLESQAEVEMSKPRWSNAPKDRKKPRMILFN